ncbi:cell division protein SepF [Rhodococcus ruber Chol-4]|uniref:Cell division protein SepF n=4 Tax=Rhodococcus TaxID=1827 RepID=M2YVX6_9NOCA|nr:MULTISPECIES: cell division protein SepF [Rhodococcus]MDO2380365.1 cell division protein SepF [Rhodococcus ruber]MDX5312898.1 cell division protein SepF [Rhodococcus sp. (in: high G+C Gram-positive bacteria)]NGR05967.1 cell division protein SepF [bacterium SGD-2]RIK12491.1 MAG: cell division protein SepF [Acidobacteriota bacterium]ATQ28141.1 cell division protein SepF [Rhodococcus ruber]
MSSLHKFKAYFGMVPLEEYEDDYLDDPASARRERDRDYDEPPYAGGGYGPSHRDEYKASRREDAGRDFEPDGFDRYEPPVRAARVEPITARAPRPTPPPARAAARSSLGSEGRLERSEARRGALFDEGGPLSKITTLRPRDYGEARTIGERFRDGTPVIMDLVEMSNADAKRLVDFAAGLAFALRGSFDKVATKVFLLSPADIDVSAEERRRIAETGFYNQQ